MSKLTAEDERLRVWVKLAARLIKYIYRFFADISQIQDEDTEV